jgi:hypothetical protein
MRSASWWLLRVLLCVGEPLEPSAASVTELGGSVYPNTLPFHTSLLPMFEPLL